MSFTCQLCGKSQAQRVKPIRLVLEYRDAEYPAIYDDKGKVIGKAGQGYEPVHEVNSCEKCAKEFSEND